MKLLISIIVFSVIIYVVFGAYLYTNQRQFFYFPTPDFVYKYDDPIAINREILENEGVSIKLTVLNKGQKNAIIYFGGNAESVDGNAENFSKIFPKHTVYLFNYRGYSGSGGEPTEAANYSDALALYDKIKEKYTDISIIGRSLGSGVATYLASKRDIKKLVLITPFDSLESVAQNAYPIYPMSLLVKDKYDSFSRAKEIKSSILIIMAEHDQVIGKEHTKRLISALPASQLKVEVIKNTGHNNISNQELFYSLLKDNFKE